jgi:hypothetical protein
MLGFLVDGVALQGVSLLVSWFSHDNPDSTIAPCPSITAPSEAAIMRNLARMLFVYAVTSSDCRPVASTSRIVSEQRIGTDMAEIGHSPI